MNRASVSQKPSRPVSARGAAPNARAREAGLELIRRINRWLIGAAVAAAGLLSLLAAQAFRGHTISTGAAASGSSASQSTSPSTGTPSSSNAGGSGPQAPAQAPAPAPAAPAPVVSGGS
jgi:hypothetical protein